MVVGNWKMIYLRGLEIQGFESGPATHWPSDWGRSIAPFSSSGDNQTVSVVWLAVIPGAHRVNVVVDPDGQVDESDMSNNMDSQNVVTASERDFVPYYRRASGRGEACLAI
jgi:hypothetical protein